mgnify:CR=1 FL=1
MGEFGWGGAYGTYFWHDPRERMYVVFMMQSPKQRVPYRALLGLADLTDRAQREPGRGVMVARSSISSSAAR